MERELTFAGNPRRAIAASIATPTTTPLATRARQYALSLLISLLLSLSAGIVVFGVLLVSLGVAVVLGGGAR